jgi:4'-phosphopantetheinyl transferase
MPASPTEQSQPVFPEDLARQPIPGADFPLPGDDELQLWRFPLPLPDGLLRHKVESLPNAAEQARAERLVFAADRLRQLHSRGLLRLLLGASLGRPPHSLRFVDNAYGKPALHDTDALHFNLSHCRDMALIGLSHAAPIGVDVERVRPLPDLAALIAHCFSHAEQVWLARQPPACQERDFFRLWTAKEAVLKALGSGLATPLDSISIHFPEAGGEHVTVDGAGAPWTLFSASPAPGHIIAAGIRTALSPNRIRQFHLADDKTSTKTRGRLTTQQETFHERP